MDGSTAFTVFITGSTTLTYEMQDQVRRAVTEARFRGWDINTGNQCGVEEAVIAACAEQGVKCWVYAAEPGWLADRRIPHQFIRFGGTKKQLDRFLTEQSDRGIVISLPDDKRAFRIVRLFMGEDDKKCSLTLCKASVL